MTHILFSSDDIARGKIFFRILKHFILRMALSTCTLTAAIVLVLSSSLTESWVDPFKKGGMFSETPSGISSIMSNPRSAMTSSPGSNKVRIPQSRVTFLSLDRPTYNSETNVGYPAGDIPSTCSPIAVLWCLYDENVAD